jgi:hypothetical protein
MGDQVTRSTYCLALLVAAFATTLTVLAPSAAAATAAGPKLSTTIIYQDVYSTVLLTELPGNRTAATLTTTFPYSEPPVSAQLILSNGTGLFFEAGETVLVPRGTEVIGVDVSYDSFLIYGEEINEVCVSATCVHTDYALQGCTVEVENLSESTATATLFAADGTVFGTITAAPHENVQVLYEGQGCPMDASVEYT